MFATVSSTLPNGVPDVYKTNRCRDATHPVWPR
jgi:hypothetical protein